MRNSYFASTLIAGVLTLTGVLLHGQATQSSILGNITDSSGAAVPNASVTVKNEGTNFLREIAVDANGDYRVSGLESGFYQVIVAAPGFKTFEQKRIDLASAQIKRVDARLEVGNVDTRITVESAASQVETETATLSNIKTGRDFAELPLSVFGRGWANVTNVAAGVQSASGFEVNGARDTANNFTTDGISYNDIISSRNTPNGFSGDIENFQEIKIITANSSAEYSQVAQFAAVSKSGTNELHGSFYWGNLNSKFQARSWADAEKPFVHQPQHVRVEQRRARLYPACLRRPEPDILLRVLQRSSLSHRKSHLRHRADRCNAERRFFRALRAGDSG